jgi:hypothetical protein
MGRRQTLERAQVTAPGAGDCADGLSSALTHKSTRVEVHDIFIEAFCLFVTSDETYRRTGTRPSAAMVGGETFRKGLARRYQINSEKERGND